MFDHFGGNFPNIDKRTKKQMKDVEMVAQLLLFLEEGVRAYNQDYLDKAFSDRDTNWEQKEEIETEFRNTIDAISKIIQSSLALDLPKTRLKNQADFYSLFGAVAELNREFTLNINSTVGQRIKDFIILVSDEILIDRAEISLSEYERNALNYYDAAKYSFTEAGARKSRILIMKSVIEGSIGVE